MKGEREEEEKNLNFPPGSSKLTLSEIFKDFFIVNIGPRRLPAHTIYILYHQAHMFKLYIYCILNYQAFSSEDTNIFVGTNVMDKTNEQTNGLHS